MDRDEIEEERNVSAQSHRVPSDPSLAVVEKDEPTTNQLLHLKIQANTKKKGSESDLSNENNSVSEESQAEIAITNATHSVSKKAQRKKIRKSEGDWVILEGLKEGQRYEILPHKQVGYLMKKRKWPLKGWHKRYFILEKGIIVYAKTPSELARGKSHGSVDVGLSVISAKTKGGRIDIDAEESIYHLKIKDAEVFCQWLELLKQHRLYRQNELSFGTKSVTRLTSPADDFSATPSSPEHQILCSPSIQPPSGALRVAAWIVDTEVLDSVSKEVTQVQQQLFTLGNILEQIEALQICENVDATPHVKKDRKRFMMRKKKGNKITSLDISTSSKVAVDDFICVESNLETMSELSSSNPSLSVVGGAPLSGSADSVSLSGALLTDARIGAGESNPRHDFYILAKEIHVTLRGLLKSVHTERDRLKQAVDSCPPPTVSIATNSSLRTALAQALQQNTELRNRLQQIHAEADITELPSLASTQEQSHRNLQQSLSYDSGSVVSNSEYYDATDLRSDHQSESSSASSGEESVLSDNSEIGTDVVDRGIGVQGSKCLTGRRSKLPAPRPETEEVSLWNLLRKNIGKDLTKISMPVTLNEPLSMLQRLCEELEYSELLDRASDTEDAGERMMYIAAFAVSAYGSSNCRAGHKPFNPLLSETYECIREDKGFRYISEQVGHHPPISACHAESRHFLYSQEIRIKAKFWGKSMEFQPHGTVSVVLPKHGERYTWNKVTTCVHNLFGSQRWVDQYGELVIISSLSNMTAKLTFDKASYWSSKRGEVYGSIFNAEGEIVHNLFGKWNEGLYCGTAPKSAKCIWRPGTMPEDYHLYYGFSKFAIELNEIEPDTAKYLPCTDSRFRPDQRLLEEGKVSESENMKQKLEQMQRDRHKVMEAEGRKPEPLWFRRTTIGDRESWEFNHRYWQCRKSPGFINMALEKLW